MLLTSIHSGTIQKYVDERAVALNRSGNRLKPATVNRELMFLSAVFREAVKRRYVERNPVDAGVVEALVAVFDYTHHPYDLRYALNEFLAANGGKVAEIKAELATNGLKAPKHLPALH